MIFEIRQAHEWIYLAVNTAFEYLTGLKNVVGKKSDSSYPDIRENDQGIINLYARASPHGQHEKIRSFSSKLSICGSLFRI
jgi:hypothetical protein